MKGLRRTGSRFLLSMDKKELRRIARRRIRDLRDRPLESSMIISRLQNLDEYRNAENILAFAPLPDEPDILPLLIDDERVMFPYIEDGRMHFSASHSLHVSAYKAMEAEHIDSYYSSALMLVPMLGYSRSLQRLGRGGGFYDRYIAENRSRITATAGIAFSASLLEEFEAEEHDAVLDMVITPYSVVRTPVS